MLYPPYHVVPITPFTTTHLTHLNLSTPAPHTTSPLPSPPQEKLPLQWVVEAGNTRRPQTPVSADEVINYWYKQTSADGRPPSCRQSSLSRDGQDHFFPRLVCEYIYIYILFAVSFEGFFNEIVGKKRGINNFPVLRITLFIFFFFIFYSPTYVYVSSI